MADELRKSLDLIPVPLARPKEQSVPGPMTQETEISIVAKHMPPTLPATFLPNHSLLLRHLISSKRIYAAINK